MLCRVGLLRWQLLRNIWVLMKIWIFRNRGNGKMDWAELFITIISLRAETEIKLWVRRAFSRKCYKYFSCVENGRAIRRGIGISGKLLCPFCLEWDQYQKWDWKEYWMYTFHVFSNIHSVYFRSTSHSEWFFIFIFLNSSPRHLVCTGL